MYDLSLTRGLLGCYDEIQDKGVLIVGLRLPFFMRTVIRRL